MLRIRDIQANPPSALTLTLSDGSVVERDIQALLVGPIFEPMRSDPARFREARAESGTVTWPNGADLCPDVLIWGGMPPSDERAIPAAKLVIASPRASA